MATTAQEFTAVGRRKTSSARVRIAPGSGKVTVNNKDLEVYCYTEQLSKTAIMPLLVTETKDSMDVRVCVQGGGPTGQASAISHGIARALQKMNPDLRPALKKAGLLTRDPRMKERKKPGQPGARKRFQFSKR